MNRFWRLLLIHWLSPSTVLIALSCVLVWHVNSLVQENRDNVLAVTKSAKIGVPDVFAESRAITIAMVYKGRPGKPETMGLIPAARQVMLDAGTAVRLGTQQVAQSAALIDATANAINGAATDVHTLALAGTGTLNQATSTLSEGQRSLAAFQPLAVESTQAVRDFDNLLTSKDLNDGFKHFNGITGYWEDISSDAYTRLHPLLNPDPCRGRWCWVRNGYGRMAALFPALNAFWEVKTAVAPVKERLVP